MCRGANLKGARRAKDPLGAGAFEFHPNSYMNEGIALAVRYCQCVAVSFH